MRMQRVLVGTAAALVLALAAPRLVHAGLFTGPWDFSLGAYNGTHRYSYNEAYGYNLPFTPTSRVIYFPSDWPAYYDRAPYWVRLPPRYYAPWFGRPVDPSLAGAPGPESMAVIVVQVPPGAELWCDGVKTRQSGPSRVFTSPPLAQGQSYHYKLRVRWVQNGAPVEQTQFVSVQPGQYVGLRFPGARPAQEPVGRR